MRELMPALKNKIYFNYGGQGPLPSKSLEAIKSSWEKIQELGPFTNNVWPYIANEVDVTKKYLADLCGVNRHRLALTENVTSGCVLPLWGLPLNNSDKILISDCEHPGVVAACREFAKRKNLHVHILKVQQFRGGLNKQMITEKLVLEELERALHKNTRLVVISHVLWNTGQIMPIQTISEKLQNHPLKPYLLVDGAQSFGHITIADAAAISDIYAFTGHKWACGPEGLGAVSVSERVLKESNPTLIGWRSLKEEASIHVQNPYPFHQDARRFEIATSCIPLLAGLRSSLNLLQKEGSETERLERIQSLSFKLWSGLKNLPGFSPILEGPPPTGLVSFSLINEQNQNSLVKNLGKQNLWIRILEDPSWLRACLHITSQEREIDILLTALTRLTKTYTT